jgi:hypothetical protein
MRVDASAVLAGDLWCGVARAVVDEQQVDGEAAGVGRDAGEHGTDGSLLVASNDNSNAPRSRFGRGCPA